MGNECFLVATNHKLTRITLRNLLFNLNTKYDSSTFFVNKFWSVLTFFSSYDLITIKINIKNSAENKQTKNLVVNLKKETNSEQKFVNIHILKKRLKRIIIILEISFCHEDSKQTVKCT